MSTQIVITGPKEHIEVYKKLAMFDKDVSVSDGVTKNKKKALPKHLQKDADKLTKQEFIELIEDGEKSKKTYSLAEAKEYGHQLIDKWNRKNTK